MPATSAGAADMCNRNYRAGGGNVNVIHIWYVLQFKGVGHKFDDPSLNAGTHISRVQHLSREFFF